MLMVLESSLGNGSVSRGTLVRFASSSFLPFDDFRRESSELTQPSCLASSALKWFPAGSSTPEDYTSGRDLASLTAL